MPLRQRKLPAVNSAPSARWRSEIGAERGADLLEAVVPQRALTRKAASAKTASPIQRIEAPERGRRKRCSLRHAIVAPRPYEASSIDGRAACGRVQGRMVATSGGAATARPGQEMADAPGDSTSCWSRPTASGSTRSPTGSAPGSRARASRGAADALRPPHLGLALDPGERRPARAGRPQRLLPPPGERGPEPLHPQRRGPRRHAGRTSVRR